MVCSKRRVAWGSAARVPQGVGEPGAFSIMLRSFLLPIVILLLASTTRASITVPPIGQGPVVPVVLSQAAQRRLQDMLTERPGRSAGNVRPTGSMRPTFDERSIVVVEQAPWEALSLGDVVLFSSDLSGPQTIAHRIVSRGRRYWRTRGDACRVNDLEELRPENYHGYRVIAAIDKQTGEVVWSAR